MGVAEEGILEELRTRIMEGKGKVSMPQVHACVRVLHRDRYDTGVDSIDDLAESISITHTIPQAMTEAVAGRIAKACREGQANALVLDGWPRGPYQLER